MAGQAARADRAGYLAGTDEILTEYGHAERACPAATRATCPAGAGTRPGPEAALKADANGYAGDLIAARQDGNHLQVGEPGRTLATGGLPRAAAIGEHEPMVSGQGAGPCRSGGRRPGLLPAGLGPALLRLPGSRLRR